MKENTLFNTLEIPGLFLVPGFCIYVLEIVKEKQKWFYIGMTGDPHYPSARSAYYRLVGHLELNQRSTQNQLRIAMREQLSEPGFIGLNDYPDSNKAKSYESVNHKNHSSDNYDIYKSIIELVNNG